MHMIGVPHMPNGVTAEMMTDWDAMCAAIAAHAPLWEPGTKSGYHAWTFGWIIGEIIRRVDGRPISQVAQEELCGPLGIEDFYLGIPDHVEGRVAPLRQESRHLAASRQLGELGLRVMPPHVTSAEVVNRPDVRRASIPGGGGIMNARAIARHYAMLAHGGCLDGVRILSPERIELIRTAWIDTVDVVFEGPVRRGLGYEHGGETEKGANVALGRSSDSFGHSGNGGSLGFADPVCKLGLGLTKNLMKAVENPAETAVYRVAELIRQHINAPA
jgi:CubicO group peptidase (beta-lactamase class C family)